MAEKFKLCSLGQMAAEPAGIAKQALPGTASQDAQVGQPLGTG